MLGLPETEKSRRGRNTPAYSATGWVTTDRKKKFYKIVTSKSSFLTLGVINWRGGGGGGRRKKEGPTHPPKKPSPLLFLLPKKLFFLAEKARPKTRTRVTD
jgi:hypothetical protein